MRSYHRENDKYTHHLRRNSDSTYACGAKRDDPSSPNWIHTYQHFLEHADWSTEEPVTCPRCLKEKEHENKLQRERRRKKSKGKKE